jgi:alpha-beta hydrolase superfamily lysophospholipase
MIVARQQPSRFTRSTVLLLLLLWTITAGAAECVILLHGLGRGHGSMTRIAEALDHRGYVVWNRGYDSTSSNVRDLAGSAVDPALDFCADHERTHFVTHSLGGILVRVALQERDFDGRIVMLSPPNQGSEIPDILNEVSIFHRLMGPAVGQLGTNGLPIRLQPIPGTIGVITGDRTSDPWFSWLIPGPDDGKVSVESARLAEMADFLVVPEGHSFIMLRPEVIEQVLYFLTHGRFQRSDTGEPMPSGDQ